MSGTMSGTMSDTMSGTMSDKMSDKLTARLMDRRSTPCSKLFGLKRLCCVASAYFPLTVFVFCVIAPLRQPPGPFLNTYVKFVITDDSSFMTHTKGLYDFNVPDQDQSNYLLLEHFQFLPSSNLPFSSSRQSVHDQIDMPM